MKNKEGHFLAGKPYPNSPTSCWTVWSHSPDGHRDAAPKLDLGACLHEGVKHHGLQKVSLLNCTCYIYAFKSFCLTTYVLSFPFEGP